MTLPVIRLSRSHWHRSQMPQIDNTPDFLQWLESRGIHHKSRDVSPATIRATQNELNLTLVFNLIAIGLNTRKYPVLVSADMHILDGHNRWYAALVQRFRRRLGFLSVAIPV